MKEINIKAKDKNLWILVIVTIITTAILTTSLFSAFFFAGYSKVKATELSTVKAKNVILLIGDGMGEKHIEATGIHEGKSLIMDTKFQAKCYVATRSLSMLPTDSAASATAMATGKKTFNGAIATKSGKNLDNLSEILGKTYNKKVGVISTKTAYDATPAAFSAHAKSRKNINSIIESQIANQNLNLLLGLGATEYQKYTNSIETETRSYCTSIEELNASTKEKAFCILPDDGIANTGNSNTLANLTDIALDKLESDDGFFLMIEGAKIDSASHSNNIKEMINELINFEDAVSVALRYANKHNDTVVIVTADHETGTIKIPNNATSDDISDKWFKSKSHTYKNVPLYYYGPGSKQIFEYKKIDNTDIFKIILHAIKNAN